MDKVLIDTDVILDFFFDRQPFANQAAQLLTLCEKGELQGFVTSIMLSNIYYLLRKTAKHDKVIESLKKLMTIMDVATTDKKNILDALNSDFLDFEDALQNFSAQGNQHIKVIITRDFKDYMRSDLSVMTPETYLKAINQ